MRNAIIGIVAITLGAVAGALVVQGRLEGQLARAIAERDTLRTQLEEARADAILPEERERVLMSEIEALQARVRSLESQQGAAQAMTFDAPFESSAAPDTDLSDFRGGSPPPDAATAGEDGERRGRRGRDENETDEQRAERWREFQRQFRERAANFFQEQYNAAPDAESQNRIAQMQQYADYLGELRDSMRNASTDEEREAIRQAMREAGTNLFNLSQQQREHMVRRLAEEYGIKDSTQQEAFVSSLQALESNPLYRPNPMMGGGMGPGGPRGGPPMGGFGGGGPRR